MRFLAIFLAALVGSSSLLAASLESLFYIDGDDLTVQPQIILNTINQHTKIIRIIAPQIYEMDQDGVIKGNIDPQLLALTRQRHLPLMPLITNIGFDQALFHQFIHNTYAQHRAIQQMIALCQTNQFAGIQFDLENINIADKEVLSQFVQEAARALHHINVVVSIAVVPRTADSFATDYDKWYYANWSGAYDYKALAQAVDFISLMSYDRHTSLTTPGPIAPIQWVKATIEFALKEVPASKISLGIPSYSGYWTTSQMVRNKVPLMYQFRSKEKQIGYDDVSTLLHQYKQHPIWQPQWQSSYLIHTSQEGLLEYLFVENAKSFHQRVELAKHYHLRGFSVWKLGAEDPAIWR